MKPFFIYSRYLPFGKFDYLTFLVWVIIKKQYNPATGVWERPVMSDCAECPIHSNRFPYPTCRNAVLIGCGLN